MGKMIRSIALALASGVVLALMPAAAAQSPAVTQSASVAAPAASQPSMGTQAGKLPPPMRNLRPGIRPAAYPGCHRFRPRKTVRFLAALFVKSIRSRDQFLLDIYGQHPMKVLYDERTQLYRDGVKIPLHDLGPADHASVQTALDGTRIFAMSVHILSAIPQGQYHGRVLSFNESTGQLRLDASPSPQPFTVRVPGNVTIVRKGQTAFTEEGGGRSDLRPGTLVNVTFGSGAGAVGVASRIEVLAVPGASFLFSGSITALDMSSGSLTLVDASDQKSYRISFAPAAFSIARDLRVGQRVRITASFNGSSYLASNITAY